MAESMKNEINEKELENVSGGAAGGYAAPKSCPECGRIMLALVHSNHGVVGYSCSQCQYIERV